jgi:tRNA dimethylallyltransferase
MPPGENNCAPVPVLVLFGPTASGKTEFLDVLFSEPYGLFPGEVVSADSMQVYRGMDIGTAKPGAELRRRLPHHLIDIRDPDEQFNAGEFVRLAGEICLEIADRGRLPVISGGTGFYIRNFVLGITEAPPSDPALRESLKREAADRGMDALFRELQGADSISAGRIHRNDRYRILRALEVCRLTGRPLSAFESTGAPGNFRFLLAGLWRDREELYSRLDARCELMFRQGLPDELKALVKKGYGPLDPGLKAIGYREFFVQGGDGKFTLSDDVSSVKELIAKNSRHYAKRQITYFNSLPGIRWIKPEPLVFSSELEKFLADQPA